MSIERYLHAIDQEVKYITLYNHPCKMQPQAIGNTWQYNIPRIFGDSPI